MSFLDDSVQKDKDNGPAATVFSEVMRIAQALDKLDIDIDIKKQELKQLEDQKRQMEEITLPAIMLQNRIDTIGLDNGRTLSVKEEVFIRIPENEEGRKTVFSFLRNNGGGHLIKETTTIEDAPAFIKKELQAREIMFIDKEAVNTNSYTAWVKSKLGMKKGSIQELSPDDFPKEANLFLYKKATIAKAK